MTDNTQPEALRDARWYMVDKDGMATLCTDKEDAEQEAKDANMAWPHTAPYRAVQLVEVGTAAAELHRQHARIAELEAQLEAIGAGGVSGPLMGKPQAMPDLSALTERGARAWAGVDAQGLREGFTAADMATASAQGFRNGVTSASVNSDGSITPGTWAHLKLMMEESAWGGEIQLSDALANVDEFARASLAASAGSEPVAEIGSAAGDDAEFGQRAIYPLMDIDHFEYGAKLYTHPSHPEGMVGGWQDIATAPKDGTYLLLWEQYSANPFVGCWAFGSWSVSHEHVDAEGGWDGAIVVDSISQDRITHWMPLPPPPTSSADSRKGE